MIARAGGCGTDIAEVTIKPVDGGFIVEWTEIVSKKIPAAMLRQQGQPEDEAWKVGKDAKPQMVKVPLHKQAVREKLEEALKLVSEVVQKNVKRLEKGESDELEAMVVDG